MPRQYSMSDPKAQRVLLGLRAGLTLRLVGERPRRFSEYCSRHPDYAREAQPLEAANAKAAYLRKGAYLREKTHCDNGHLLAEHARFAVYKGWKTRKCKICHHMRYRRGGVMKAEILEKVTARITAGASLSSFTKTGGQGYLLGFYTLARYRRENPGFDGFVTQALANRIIRRSDPLHPPGTFRYDWEPTDQHAIALVLPRGFPGKDDVLQSIFVALIEGRLQRSDVQRHLSFFLSGYNRQHPTKFAKFGNSLLVSLDEVILDDGSGTRGDLVTRGLWD
jgi:hypothetical protein